MLRLLHITVNANAALNLNLRPYGNLQGNKLCRVHRLLSAQKFPLSASLSAARMCVFALQLLPLGVLEMTSRQ